MTDRKYDQLLLKNQICFPLYAAAKGVVSLYRPMLDEVGLTYTQYITMMVLWEEGETDSKELGKRLYLDSGTLTPVLKSLEKKGFINRHRSGADERRLIVSVTDEGYELREKCIDIPSGLLAKCSCLSAEEAEDLYKILIKLNNSIQ